MTIRAPHFKRSVELTEIVQGVKPYVMGGYVRVTEWSLTTSGPTGEVVLRTSQLAWFLVTRIGYGNLSGLKLPF